MDTEPTPERWITHREAAELWGITVDSARLKLTRYARERGWQVQSGNSGKKRYRVPEHYTFPARASGEQSPEPAAALPEHSPDHAKEISRLAEALAAALEHAARADARADAMLARADAAQAALEDERRKRLWTRIREAWGGR